MPSLMGLRAPTWPMSSETIETSSADLNLSLTMSLSWVLENPSPKLSKPEEAEDAEAMVLAEPLVIAVAGADVLAGIEEELGP